MDYLWGEFVDINVWVWIYLLRANKKIVDCFQVKPLCWMSWAVPCIPLTVVHLVVLECHKTTSFPSFHLLLIQMQCFTFLDSLNIVLLCPGSPKWSLFRTWFVWPSYVVSYASWVACATRAGGPPAFLSQFCYVLVMWSWESYLTASTSFSIWWGDNRHVWRIHWVKVACVVHRAVSNST